MTLEEGEEAGSPEDPRSPTEQGDDTEEAEGGEASGDAGMWRKLTGFCKKIYERVQQTWWHVRQWPGLSSRRRRADVHLDVEPPFLCSFLESLFTFENFGSSTKSRFGLYARIGSWSVHGSLKVEKEDIAGRDSTATSHKYTYSKTAAVFYHAL